MDLAFAFGSALLANNQEMIATGADTRRVFALSWNNSSLYAGVALGTALLNSFPLGSSAFIVVVISFALISSVFSFIGLGFERRSQTL